MSRFAILEHDHPYLHWDLFLEWGESEFLRAWRLESPPTALAEIAAEALPDHRPLYLTYEGPISGGRGSVCRWDAGNFEMLNVSERMLCARVHSAKLRGLVLLTRSVSTSWHFRFEPEGDQLPG